MFITISIVHSNCVFAEFSSIKTKNPTSENEKKNDLKTNRYNSKFGKNKITNDNRQCVKETTISFICIKL